MKIAIISPNAQHLQVMSKVLEARSHKVTCVEGGKGRMRQVAEHEKPQLMLVDGMCCDPDELTLIEDVTTRHPDVAVMLLCASQTSEFLINSMRAGVREVLPSPVAPEALEAAVSRLAAKLAGRLRESAGQVLAFMPCKGGSGATFIATNLGWHLAQTKSVLLIDLNLQFGDALSYVHEAPPVSTLADVAVDIGRLDASFLAASATKVAPNFSVLAAPADPSKAMEVKPEHVEAILKLAVTQYDFVLLDVEQSMSTLVIRALDQAQRIYPVLQADLPAIRNAKKLLDVFRSLGYPPEKVELIVNRFGKSGEIGLNDLRRALGPAPLLTLPNAYKEVSMAINRGVPLLESARSSAVNKGLADLARALNPAQQDPSSLLGRLFRRA